VGEGRRERGGEGVGQGEIRCRESKGERTEFGGGGGSFLGYARDLGQLGEVLGWQWG
jgi:hypothetical protein